MFLNMSFIDRIIIILWLELKLNSFYVFRWRCGFKIEEWNGKEPNLVIKGATKVFDFKNHKIKLTEIIIKSPSWRIVNKKTIDFIIHITKIFNSIPMLYWNIFELSFGSKFDILRRIICMCMVCCLKVSKIMIWLFYNFFIASR